MGLVDIVPEFNLYEEFWKIYTNSESISPQFIGDDSHVERSMISGGSQIYGTVYNSVLGYNVVVNKGAVIKDSIIMNNVTIGENTRMNKAIIADGTTIGSNVVLGDGEEVPNEIKPNIYCDGIVTIGENSVIPDNTSIGKNTAIYGVTREEDYVEGKLPSGGYLVKEGEEK